MLGNISTVQDVVKAEHRIAALAGRTYAKLAPRATTALVALLRALNLPPDSEALMPISLCPNPVNAVRWAGLKPLFADISPHTFSLDLDAAESVVGRHTRVILAIPMFGQPLDAPALMQFAEWHDLLVIEDAAQAVGLHHARQEPAGSLGICSVYSFGTGKIADAGGGSALISDDGGLMARIRAELANMPSSKRDLSGQASLILTALDDLPAELEARAKLADLYSQTLKAPTITHPQVAPHTPLWKYSVLLPTREERDRITRTLIETGVPATNLYPPLTRFFLDTHKAYPIHCPIAKDTFNRIINLPLWPQPPDLLETVVQAFAT